MLATSNRNSTSELAQSKLSDSQFLQNRYFKALSDGRMSLDHFQDSQAKFFHAVKFFARPMSLLISRMPEPATRLTILHNIVEEHGDFERSQFHESTFRQFLISIGLDSAAPTPGAPVDAFNLLLLGVCDKTDIATAVCCLGMIELAFAGASAAIGKSVVERGWIDNSELVHYKLHSELDIQHAAEFFDIVETEFEQKREQIERGLELGLYAFNRLYEDLAPD